MYPDRPKFKTDTAEVKALMLHNHPLCQMHNQLKPTEGRKALKVEGEEAHYSKD